VLPELEYKGLFETADVNVAPTETEEEIAGVFVFDVSADTLTEGVTLIDVLGLIEGIGVALVVAPIDGEFEIALDGDNVFSALTDVLEDRDGDDDDEMETD